MNKMFLTLAIAAFGLCGMSAMAQDEAPACQGNKMYQPQVFTDYAFEGIILDTDQQAKMDKINEQYKPIVNGTLVRGSASCPGDSAQCKQGRKGPRPDKAQCDSAQCRKGPRPDKAQCDSAQCRPGGPRGGFRGQRPDGPRPEGPNPMMQARKEYIEQVKEVLTPDQYVVFLENIVMAPQQPQMGPGPQGPRGQKGPGRDCKGQPCPKAQCPDNAAK